LPFVYCLRRIGNFEVPATSSPHNVTVQFVFHRGVAGAANALAELFDIRLDCRAPTYGHLSGSA
jgi:hypothetical protein